MNILNAIQRRIIIAWTRLSVRDMPVIIAALVIGAAVMALVEAVMP